MNTYYSDEKNIQILISLLKQNGIKKIVASPGGTNVTFVASLQSDPYFEIYSSVDERSAAYIATGLSAESGEPVVLSCTGATASRNYMPGLTEAFYRKLPILAVTSTQDIAKVGNHIAQVTDRSNIPNDVAKLSVQLPIVDTEREFTECELKVNKAILELKRQGGGPVHINIPTQYSTNYDVQELPFVRKIDRISVLDSFPKLPNGKIAIFVGSHKEMSSELTESIDNFCATNDAVVLCDHTSGYAGKFRVNLALVASQSLMDKSEIRPDLMIHIGEITGDYATIGLVGKEVWRVNEDGEIRDTFNRLSYVFEMPLKYFFDNYDSKKENTENSYYKYCKNIYYEILNKIPEVPLSNVWFASKMAHLIPKGSTIHFGILNSLRTWNFFELPENVKSASNVGGFGIDGSISSILGASLTNREKLYFAVIGDLAFFYDINALGNRHVSNNLRLLLVNNGKGTEFKVFNNRAAQFGDDTDQFIAAAGHFGNKSPELVKNFAQNLGFDYFAANNKDEFESVYKKFLNPEITDKPILFEVFTTNEDESDALQKIMNIEVDTKVIAKNIAKNILGEKGMKVLKGVFK